MSAGPHKTIYSFRFVLTRFYCIDLKRKENITFPSYYHWCTLNWNKRQDFIIWQALIRYTILQASRPGNKKRKTWDRFSRRIQTPYLVWYGVYLLIVETDKNYGTYRSMIQLSVRAIRLASSSDNATSVIIYFFPFHEITFS